LLNGLHKKTISTTLRRPLRHASCTTTCASVRAIHDYRTLVLDTLFGRLRVKAARLRRCPCDARSATMPNGPISPLAIFFPDRATPELQRLHADLGSRHSFREAARLTADLDGLLVSVPAP
jgi:hypothetical protein